METFIDIDGLDEVLRDLSDLPGKIVREMFPDALAAGGAVLEAELESRTPESPVETTSGKKYGTLREDIGTEIKVNPQSLTGSAKVGFGAATGHVVRFVEFGHRQVTHAGKEVGRAAPHPFMRTAADTAEDAAVEAFEESLGEQL